MRKLLLTGLVAICLMAAAPGMASASIFTFDLNELLGMAQVHVNGQGDLDSKVSLPDGIQFIGDIYDGTPQWRSIQIGYDKTGVYGQRWGDLSGYDGYALSFKNVNQQEWIFNTYMNTGYTDAPWSEQDAFYQGTWTSLLPGESASILVDFAGADTWINGSNSFGPVANLNHISSIGFMVAFNDPNNVYGTNLYQGDDYHVLVSPVPEPMTMMLFGSGLLGLVGLRKKA